jgi:hypothetical protein
MPQLVQGGKWVYGWCIINNDQKISIPPAAFTEYEFVAGETVLFIKGSKRSGGLGIARQQSVTIMPVFARIFSQGVIEENRIIRLPKMIDCHPGEKLLAIRGSGLALSLIQFGPIIEEAENHTELEIFLVKEELS